MESDSISQFEHTCNQADILTGLKLMSFSETDALKLLIIQKCRSHFRMIAGKNRLHLLNSFEHEFDFIHPLIEKRRAQLLITMDHQMQKIHSDKVTKNLIRNFTRNVT